MKVSQMRRNIRNLLRPLLLFVFAEDHGELLLMVEITSQGDVKQTDSSKVMYRMESCSSSSLLSFWANPAPIYIIYMLTYRNSILHEPFLIPI